MSRLDFISIFPILILIFYVLEFSCSYIDLLFVRIFQKLSNYSFIFYLIGFVKILDTLFELLILLYLRAVLKNIINILFGGFLMKLFGCLKFKNVLFCSYHKSMIVFRIHQLFEDYLFYLFGFHAYYLQKFT